MYAPLEKKIEKNRIVKNPIIQKKGGEKSLFSKNMGNTIQRRLKSITTSNSSNAEETIQLAGKAAKKAALISKNTHDDSDYYSEESSDDEYDVDPIRPLLENWVASQVYIQIKPQVRRLTNHPNDDVSVNYNIEFTWQNAITHNGRLYNVMAHLHVINGTAIQTGGGIWITGISGSGLNWNSIPEKNNFLNFIIKYVE